MVELLCDSTTTTILLSCEGVCPVQHTGLKETQIKLSKETVLNQDYVTTLHISCLKCFEKHILVYCLAVIQEIL